MKARPILFNGEMVRALLDGRKSQTRRPMKDQPESVVDIICPPSQIAEIGDLFYVRETWHENHTGELLTYRADWAADNDPFSDAFYGEDCSMVGEKWRPSIHMPRKASRLTLLVTDIHSEKASDISSYGAVSEGIQWDQRMQGYHVEDGRFFNSASPELSFAGLFDSIYGDIHQWVWVIEFEVIKANVDAVIADMEKAA